MIFGAGFFLFIVALAMTMAERPKPAGFLVSLAGCSGLLLMLASLCLLLARVLP